MRILLIRTLVLTLGSYAVWVFAGPKIAAVLDRIYTVADVRLALGNFALQPGEFDIGRKRWFLSADLLIGADSRRRVTLAAAGRIFAFGPIQSCSAASAGYCYEFVADPGDEISFERSRSWLAWPTPLEFSIMGAPMTSWRRHSYRRLFWKKISGASIEMVWRDEQGYFSKAGWTDGNLQIAPVVTITPGPFERVVVSYLLQKKGWKRDVYRLEARGASSDGLCDVTAAVYLKDLVAVKPGAGESIEVYVERKSGEVLREAGMQ